MLGPQTRACYNPTYFRGEENLNERWFERVDLAQFMRDSCLIRFPAINLDPLRPYLFEEKCLRLWEFLQLLPALKA